MIRSPDTDDSSTHISEMIKDIHTHRKAPDSEAIVNIDRPDITLLPGQAYSIGIHPWNAGDTDPDTFQILDSLVAMPCVVAIGECGIDNARDTPLFRQMLAFRHCVELSEKYTKPLIIHCVRAHDIILGLHRDLHPTQAWIIHGFRQKPTIAKMLTDAGIYLSFGEKFNPESLMSCPKDRLLAETDESSLSIDRINAMHDSIRPDASQLSISNASKLFSQAPE